MRALTFMLLAILALGVENNAFAGCGPPAGPTITETEISITLHTYAEGSRVCIHTFSDAHTNTCAICKSGYWHKCHDGYWRYELSNKCSPEEAKPYINGVEQNASPAGLDRNNLLDGMLDGHIGAQDRLDTSNRDLENNIRANKSRSAREASEDSRKNLERSQRSLLNAPTQTENQIPGTLDSNNDARRCEQVQRHIAQNIQSGASSGSSASRCDAAREILSMLTYAKSNLERYGCYRGEYDQNISEYRSDISTNC